MPGFRHWTGDFRGLSKVQPKSVPIRAKSISIRPAFAPLMSHRTVAGRQLFQPSHAKPHAHCHAFGQVRMASTA
jgi:hypothetical protein